MHACVSSQKRGWLVASVLKRSLISILGTENSVTTKPDSQQTVSGFGISLAYRPISYLLGMVQSHSLRVVLEFERQWWNSCGFLVQKQVVKLPVSVACRLELWPACGHSCTGLCEGGSGGLSLFLGPVRMQLPGLLVNRTISLVELSERDRGFLYWALLAARTHVGQFFLASLDSEIIQLLHRKTAKQKQHGIYGLNEGTCAFLWCNTVPDRKMHAYCSFWGICLRNSLWFLSIFLKTKQNKTTATPARIVCRGRSLVNCFS